MGLQREHGVSPRCAYLPNHVQAAHQELQRIHVAALFFVSGLATVGPACRAEPKPTTEVVFALATGSLSSASMGMPTRLGTSRCSFRVGFCRRTSGWGPSV